MTVNIIGMGTATPARRYTQRECWDALKGTEILAALSPRSRALLCKVLTGKNGITSRYLALDPLSEFMKVDPDTLHARFLRYAPAIVEEAAVQALADASVGVDEIDGVVVSTCTGYLCPGLSSYLAERLKLRDDLISLDLVGHGCGAAIPNLRTGAALLDSGQCKTVLCVTGEICSAAFYLDDDPGVLVSACLFADGAAAAVLRAAPAKGKRSVQWLDSHSILDPANRDALRFEQRGGMLRNILTQAVPGLVAQQVPRLLAMTLPDAEITRDDIRAWVFHAAGRDVLDAIRESLRLPESELAWSRAVLDEYGNLSSGSVMFALHKALRGGAPDGYWWLSSFGAGFCCHDALLRVAA